MPNDVCPILFNKPTDDDEEDENAEDGDEAEGEVEDEVDATDK